MKKPEPISDVFNQYISRFDYISFHTPDTSNDKLKAIIVIPCYNEPNITACLESVYNTQINTTIFKCIVVVNAADESPQQVKEQNQQSIQDIEAFCLKYGVNNIYTIVFEDMPKKHAGVGLARKVGMDEAARKFSLNHNPDGIIICLDADCTVSENYIDEIISTFERNAKTDFATIKYKHLLEGLDPIYAQSITLYEKHLNYYSDALNYCQLPYHFQTVGSCMVVKVIPYMLSGGMNKRKAGEDFYFLHKLAKTYTHQYIENACVYPSARISDRVPFGTGKAMNEIIFENHISLKTYHPEIFKVIKVYVSQMTDFYNHDNAFDYVPQELIAYIQTNNYIQQLTSIKRQSTNEKNYLKRLFHWFDGFEVLKMVHYLRDHTFGEMDVNKIENIF